MALSDDIKEVRDLLSDVMAQAEEDAKESEDNTIYDFLATADDCLIAALAEVTVAHQRT
jgi:hypothetical protein